jgi:hypothetical protein
MWGLWPDIYYSLTVSVLFLRGAFSDERTGQSFVYAAGPRQTIFYCLRFETSLFVASYDSAGSRWRYSNPPPHSWKKISGRESQNQSQSYIATDDRSISKSSGAHDQIFITVEFLSTDHMENTPVSIVAVQLLQLPSNGNMFTEPISRSLHSNHCPRYSIVLYSIILK